MTKQEVGSWSEVGDLGIFWAKSQRDGESSMSVLQHATDTAGIIGYTTERLLAPRVIQKLEEAFAPLSTLDVLRFAAWSHDVGKISAYFSPKVPALHGRVSARGYRATAITPVMLTANPHSLVGARSVKSWLISRVGRARARKSAAGWVNVIGGHHGVFPTGALSSPTDIEDENWKSARERFLDVGIERLGLSEKLEELATLKWTTAEQVLVTGLLIVADWVASNETNFPYEASREAEDESFTVRQRRARKSASFGGLWKPSADFSIDRFAERFALPDNAQPRHVQRAAMDVARRQPVPALHIIESETGSGKTEAALAMAEVLGAKFDLGGLFFAQPTRVTSDAMFDRVAQWLEGSESTDKSISLILAHGKAELNDYYSALANVGMPTSVYDSEGAGGLSIEAHSWFRGRKTGLLAPVVVGTIDQLLFAALRSKHLALRHLGLAGKVVIIDEVHAADSYMRVYLTRILEWLGYYGVPVIALSATQPPEIRSELIGAYRRGATGMELVDEEHQLDKSDAYPRITSADRAGVQTDFPDPENNKRQVSIEFLAGNEEDVARAALTSSLTGGCIAVICNTVSRAQRVYETIAAETGEVVLLHSRFLTSDRMRREADLVSRLGRSDDRRPKRLIVVSTQILEQGLDVDFDLMFSDIAPLDLLIQRAGRLHRHVGLTAVRPEDKRNARMVITGSDRLNLESDPPTFARGIAAVYRKAALLRSAAVLARHLEERGGLLTIPDDVASLVARAYDPSLESPPAWRDAWTDADSSEDDYRTRQRQSASQFCIASPMDQDPLESWGGALSIADEARGVAQVRDADESFEVIVVQRREGRLYPLPDQEFADIPVDGTVGIEWAVAKSLARCTVRLPGWVLTDAHLFALESDGQESWQTSPWLAGQLPLVLDENFERRLEDIWLAYSNEFGLLIDRWKE